jgi:hypothetical protein
MIPVIRAGSHTQQYVGYANNDWDLFEMGSTGQAFETLISNMINMRMGTWISSLVVAGNMTTVRCVPSMEVVGRYSRSKTQNFKTFGFSDLFFWLGEFFEGPLVFCFILGYIE